MARKIKGPKSLREDRFLLDLSQDELRYLRSVVEEVLKREPEIAQSDCHPLHYKARVALQNVANKATILWEGQKVG